MKVLIAEDDVTSRMILERLLPKWGYEVEAVGRGDEALVRMSSPGAPKLAILDRSMPGLEGVEVCRRIRAATVSGEPPYLILLTTHGATEGIVEGLEAGANDYIAKPYDAAELQARLKVGTRVVELQAVLARQIQELQEAMRHIKVLQGILPLCMYCHKIRTDQQSWQRLEGYIMEHSDALLSHSICPECMVKHEKEIFGNAAGK